MYRQYTYTMINLRDNQTTSIYNPPFSYMLCLFYRKTQKKQLLGIEPHSQQPIIGYAPNVTPLLLNKETPYWTQRSFQDYHGRVPLPAVRTHFQFASLLLFSFETLPQHDQLLLYLKGRMCGTCQQYAGPTSLSINATSFITFAQSCVSRLYFSPISKFGEVAVLYERGALRNRITVSSFHS